MNIRDSEEPQLARAERLAETTNPVGARRDIKTQLAEIEGLGYICGLLILAIVTALTVAVMADKIGIGPALYIFSLGSTASLASATAGAVLGFIFGVPRLLNRFVANEMPSAEQPKDNALQRGYLLSNSNLEAISDWLTNILVGLGLIHLTALPRYLERYRDWLEQGLANVAGPNSIAIATAVVMLTIATLAGSFLFFYVQTRTRLTLLLSDTEEARIGGVAARKLAEAPQFDRSSADGGGNDAPANALKKKEIRSAKSLDGDAQVLSGRAPNKNDEASYWAAWAAASARNGDWENSEGAWHVAVEKMPDNANYRAQYGDVLQAIGKFRDAMIQFDKAIALAGPNKRFLVGKLLAALYDEDKALADVAIETAEKLYQNPTWRKDPWIKIWRICAYAQKYLLLQSDNPQREAIKSTVKDALVEFTQQLPNPENRYRIFLRQLLEPRFRGGDPAEDDLTVFKDDADIVELIRGNPPAPE